MEVKTVFLIIAVSYLVLSIAFLAVEARGNDK